MFPDKTLLADSVPAKDILDLLSWEILGNFITLGVPPVPLNTENHLNFKIPQDFLNSPLKDQADYYLISIGHIKNLMHLQGSIKLCGHSHLILSQSSEDWIYFAQFKYKIATDFWLTSQKTQKVFFSQNWGIPTNRIMSVKTWQKKLSLQRTMHQNTRFHYGYRHYTQNDYASVISILHSDKNIRSVLICGFSFLKTNRPVEASSCFHKALISESYMSDACLGLALAHLSTGNLKQGLVFLRKAKAHQPFHTEILFALNHVSELVSEKKGTRHSGWIRDFLLQSVDPNIR